MLVWILPPVTADMPETAASVVLGLNRPERPRRKQREQELGAVEPQQEEFWAAEPACAGA